jgi:hypothetical protein
MPVESGARFRLRHSSVGYGAKEVRKALGIEPVKTRKPVVQPYNDRCFVRDLLSQNDNDPTHTEQF